MDSAWRFVTPVCVSPSSYREARLASTINSRWTPDYCDWKFAGTPADLSWVLFRGIITEASLGLVFWVYWRSRLWPDGELWNRESENWGVILWSTCSSVFRQYRQCTTLCRKGFHTFSYHISCHCHLRSFMFYATLYQLCELIIEVLGSMNIWPFHVSIMSSTVDL